MKKSLRAQRDAWWDEKQIGKSIELVGGIEFANISNILTKNPELFITREECKEWLQNKLTASRAIEKTPKRTQKRKNPTKPLSEIILCPSCGQQNIITSGAGRKCRECGFNIPGRADKIIGKKPYVAHPTGEGSPQERSS